MIRSQTLRVGAKAYYAIIYIYIRYLNIPHASVILHNCTKEPAKYTLHGHIYIALVWLAQHLQKPTAANHIDVAFRLHYRRSSVV